MFPSFPITLFGRPWEIVRITSNQSDYLLTDNLAAIPSASPRKVIVKIFSGVTISSSSTSNAAFRTGSLPSGSKVRIINDGDIIGAGGAGGAGGSVTSSSCGNGQAGNAGGDAIDLSINVTIDNTNGNIFGGGGGGGGGGGALTSQFRVGGGGGGGGAGNAGGAGGTGGTASGASICNWPGSNGSEGGVSGGGGGAGGNCSGVLGGTGGTGGDYGASGSGGGNGSSGAINCSGASGAAAGKAVELNGNTITWLGGNNPTQVKGGVS